MFCDQCGGQLQAGQKVCPRCGKPVLGFNAPQANRVREHLRLVGVLWMAYSALHVVGGIVLMVVANTIFNPATHMGEPGPNVAMWLRPLLMFIACLLAVKGAAGFIAGWGLLQQESWARILTIVVAFLSLFNIPLGTILGIYTLWVLLPAQSDQEYSALSAAA